MNFWDSKVAMYDELFSDGGGRGKLGHCGRVN